MRREIDERTCDQCGKVASEASNNRMIGGSVWSGWLRVERTGGSTGLAALQRNNGTWDFCGAACCIEFLSANVRHEARREKGWT